MNSQDLNQEEACTQAVVLDGLGRAALARAQLQLAQNHLDFAMAETEGQAVAANYLHRLRGGHEACLAQLDAIRTALRMPVEPIDLQAALNGYAQRCGRLKIWDLQIVHVLDEAPIAGTPTLLALLFTQLMALQGGRTCRLGLWSGTEAGRGFLRIGPEEGASARPALASPPSLDRVAAHPEAVRLLGVLELLEGHLLLEETPQGDRWHVRLPLAVVNHAEGRAAAASLRGSGTIMVVDDEDMIWDILMEYLQDLGYTVILAGNGLEAVETYRSNPGEIDLVILDVVMPEMNGREAFRRLQLMNPDVKVIVASGYMDEREASDLLQGGVKAFLRKPYRMAELAELIKKFMRE